MVIVNESDYLAHYGVPRRSGRYPWGSGGNETNTRNKTLLDHIADMKKEGLTDTEIARGLGLSTTQFRAQRTIAKNAEKQANQAQAQSLKDKGWSNTAIAQRMGLAGESSVRALLAPGEKDKVDILQTTANLLKKRVDEDKYIDVGSGVEEHLNVSATKLRAAIALLQEQGYQVHSVSSPQLSSAHDTRMKVLVPPGVTQKEVWQNQSAIKQVNSFTNDNGRTFLGIHKPLPVSPDRVAVRYKEDGGDKADGVIYVRPGVDDISLGKSAYAQVRVNVGDSHYLKGMAMYKDDLPPGVDLLFNTNKSSTGNKLDAMKPLLDDPDNPFGAIIRRQIVKKNDDGSETLTSAMNIVNEEGDWLKWSKTLASQVLSKQSPTLAKRQLDITYENRKKEFEKILELTNPTVRKKLLEEFADGADSASVQLKAAKIPRQGWHAILPIESIPKTQVYAPNFRDGERVALIRYPHGGTFEIPDLIVNNNHPQSKRLLGQARDAIGIHPSVAERLSGADFDGDTVLVIPNNQGRIRITPALEGLKGFDPRHEYPGYEGMKVMSNTQTEMGKISNLITDMTIRGAPASDIVRAVRHSMVVIDAEKHGLDYRLSAQRNGIKQLVDKYQVQAGGKRAASTLISRARGPIDVPDRKPRRSSMGGPIDPTTGKKVFEPTGKINWRTGKPATIKSKKLAETEDAHTLSSGTPIENLYADHSNRLKALANQARMELVRTPPLKRSESARKVYANEVASLNHKLSLAVRNRPLERQARILANAEIRARRAANPDMDEATLRKIKFQALEAMRARVGAKKKPIEITQSEWDAIQAGAISNSKLSEILDNADMNKVRELATPKREPLMTSSKTARAQRMLAGGATRAEVASALGVSITTLDTALNPT